MPLPATEPFLLGVNYPWRNYAQDFGQGPAAHLGISSPEIAAPIAEDFALIRECGAVLVRWFLFGDGRGGFLTEKGIPQKPDPLLFTDVAAALHLAEQFGLKLCFSLMDFLWLQDRGNAAQGHANARVLQFAAGRTAFLENVLIPLFQEFRAHPALFAWEIANEPEWAIREFHRNPTARMRFADFRAFAGEIAEAVHEFAKVPVTLGSARLSWVRAWHELGLDLYQAHYYPSAEGDTGAGLAKQLADLSTLDKPLWLGEVPASNSPPGYSLESVLNICREAGLLGAAVWRWTIPEPTGSDLAVGQITPAVLRAWIDSEQKQDLRV
jgi:hypothetical protein